MAEARSLVAAKRGGPSAKAAAKRLVVRLLTWLVGPGDVRTQLQMLWLHASIILPLRAVGPGACGYWSWRILQRLRGRHQPARPVGPVMLVLREIAKMWLAVEAFFVLYYFYKRRKFEAQVAKPPQIPLGQVLPTLRRMFRATEDIQEWGKVVEPGSRPSCLWTPPPGGEEVPRQASLQDLQQLLHPHVNESNVEELLREWDGMQREQHGHASSLQGFGAESMANVERLMDDAELEALKQAEVSGWFVSRSTGSCIRWPAVRLGEIGRGNLEEFLAWAFYHSEPGKVPKERHQEYEEVMREGMRWVGMQMKDGYNPDAQPMRVTFDRIVSKHRPFVWYATTALIFPLVVSRLLSGLGFRQYKSGTMSYWHRPPREAEESDESPSNRGAGVDHGSVPLVFIHGVGVNLLPYYLFIKDLCEAAPHRTILLVSLPHISMHLQENVPSSAEMVAALSDMLFSWGFSAGHFIGHSFGSLPLAWMVRRAPKLVSMVTFIDPVCFLLIKPDVCYNFIYKEPQTPSQLLSNFFVARELFIAYSLSRNFFWFMNVLWPEDVTMPSVVALSGEDSIVPAHSVRRYLAVYKRRHGLDRLKVLWFPDHSHGECFAPGKHGSRRSIIDEALLVESAHAGRCRLGALGTESPCSPEMAGSPPWMSQPEGSPLSVPPHVAS